MGLSWLFGLCDIFSRFRDIARVSAAKEHVASVSNPIVELLEPKGLKQPADKGKGAKGLANLSNR
jgi:hypothetical protein